MKNENCYVFCKREDVLCAFDKIEAIIRDYGKASAADLYKILGVPADSDDTAVGWTTTKDFVIEKYHDGIFGWVLKYPAPKPFKPEALKTALNRISSNSIYGSSMVNHPSHYQSDSGLEVIDVIEAFTKELKGAEAFCVANAIKYLCRFDKKNGVEDLEKAEWYIKRAIKYRKKHDKKADKANIVLSYAEADAKNTTDMLRKIMQDDTQQCDTTTVEYITNITELEHYTSLINDFEKKHLIMTFKSQTEVDAFVGRLNRLADEKHGCTVKDFSFLCDNFAPTASKRIGAHYGDTPEHVLWANRDDINIDDRYTHEDGSVTLSIEYPTIHTNKED